MTQSCSSTRAKTRGVLDFDLPECKMSVGDHAGPADLLNRRAERLDAHKLIEEFMIAANRAVARALREGSKTRDAFLPRARPAVAWKRSQALRNSLPRLTSPSPKVACSRPEAFNRILARVKGRDAEQLVNEVVLRTQAQAEYAAENYGHFGLNLRRYAHFTSPIRRYADLVVHRGLIRALKLGQDGLPDGVDQKALAEVAAQISATERRAMLAERETNDRLIAHFLADRIGASFEGRISGVTRAGLFVKLRETGADGFVPPVRSVTNISGTTKQATQWLVRVPAKPTGWATP